MKPPLIIIYGDHGLGKTSWAASSNKPVFIRTEDGMGMLDAARFDDVCTSYEMFLDQLKSLAAEDHDYQTLVIDSLDHLEPHVWAKTVAAAAATNSKIKQIEDFGYGKGYAAALVYWRQIIDGLQYLRTVKKMTIILLAHCNVREFADPNSDSYGRWQIKLHKTASALLQESVETILFLTSKTYTEKNGDSERVRALGTGERVIYTAAGRPTYVAKNRYDLPEELPFPPGRGWATFMAAVTSKIPNPATWATAK